MKVAVPGVLEHRDFRYFVGGVAFSGIGNQATAAAMLYQVYAITGSTLQVGLVGLSRGIAIVVLSPLGGHFADQLERKRLLQVTQALSMLVSLTLAVLTLLGVIEVWQLLVGSLLSSAANTFDAPTRKAIIPALVPKNELVQAFSLVNPMTELGKLVGPGVAGVVIAVSNPGVVYLLDGLTYLVLIVILAMLNVPRLSNPDRSLGMYKSIKEGVIFVRQRPLIIHLILLDLSAMLFAAYRVILPALALDTLGVGPIGYGVLSAAVPAGALVGSVIVYRLATRSPAGRVVLVTTGAFGASAILLAQSRSFLVALVAVTLLGVFDAIGTTIRHAAVLLETPDHLRGRVGSLYMMASRGGPALGQVNIGWLGSIMSATLALTLGGLVPLGYAIVVAVATPVVRSYRTGAEQDVR